MCIIGIITQNDNTIEIEDNLKKYNINSESIIVINEENAKNIEHVKFDIIVVYEEIRASDVIVNLINNAKYLIINVDFKENMKLLDSNSGAFVITFGFNSKSTIAIISNENEEIILEIQREIENIKKIKIEVQEIKIARKFGKKHIYEEIAMKILTILTKI